MPPSWVFGRTNSAKGRWSLSGGFLQRLLAFVAFIMYLSDVFWDFSDVFLVNLSFEEERKQGRKSERGKRVG